jgi:hypothetical protein
VLPRGWPLMQCLQQISFSARTRSIRSRQIENFSGRTGECVVPVYNAGRDYFG